MMKKVLIIFIVLVTLIGSGFMIIRNKSRVKSNDVTRIEEVIESNDSSINEGISDESKEENDLQKEIKEVESNSPKEEPKNNTSSDSKSTTKKDEVNKESKPTINQESKAGHSDENLKQEEKPVAIQKQPWEELGLTEDQYKNQPMYSWEEVDFKTKDECMNYGNEHAEYGFECSEVTSWTRSLGWDYKTF